MRCAYLAISLLTLVGCHSGKAVISGNGSTTGDDTASGDDTAIGDDTGSPQGTELTFVLSGNTDDTVLTLTRIRFSDSNDEPTFGDVLASAPVSGATVSVTPPVPNDLDEVDPTNAPGLMGAFFLPALSSDDNGNGAYDDGEPFVGIGLSLPTYFSGPIPASWTSVGVVEGWNALEFDFDSTNGGVTAVGDVSAIPLDTNLWPVSSITIGGTYGGTVKVDGLRLALLPYAAFHAGSLSGFMILEDEALTETWTLSVDGEPPANHFLSSVDWLSEIAGELPVAYKDQDDSEDLTDGDQWLYLACSGSDAVALFYTPELTDRLAALYYAMSGAATGWSAWAFSPGGNHEAPTALSSSEANRLVISSDCVDQPEPVGL